MIPHSLLVKKILSERVLQERVSQRHKKRLKDVWGRSINRTLTWDRRYFTVRRMGLASGRPKAGVFCQDDIWVHVGCWSFLYRIALIGTLQQMATLRALA